MNRLRVDGEGNGTPLQYSCLENPMDGGARWAAVHGVTRSQTWLSDFTFTFHFHALEKEMATHSSVLAWRIPGMGKPGGLPSMGSHRVGHDWSDLAAEAAEDIKEVLTSWKVLWFSWRTPNTSGPQTHPTLPTLVPPLSQHPLCWRATSSDPLGPRPNPASSRRSLSISYS